VAVANVFCCLEFEASGEHRELRLQPLPAGVGSPSAEHRSVISGTIRRRRSVATGMVTVVDVRPATQYSNDVRIYRYVVQYCKRNETSGVVRQQAPQLLSN
jgi:hypothetical protein